ncbi:MAG: hypothetical protein NTY07_02810 [Bacteroidia bacterium]|nr:hypothetical protein [Bacteroidia bacterium]
MEAKTILRLIKDDITHLEEITGEFILESLPSSDEVELSLVRAKALLRELELLHKLAVLHENSSKMISTAKAPTVYHSEQEPFELFDRETSDNEQEVMVIPGQEDFIPLEEVQDTELHLNVQPGIEESPEVLIDASPTEEHFTAVIEPDESGASGDEIQNELIENNEEAAVEPEVPVAEETTKDEILIVSDIPDHKEEILAEEFSEVKKTLNETLGDSHQLVNDILSPEKSEPGYQIIPINSIWDGIGINDRFLFIRELFANSSAKFETTIYALDKLATIQDAVNYLKMNFKWNKTEASQKFLVLVKRRFIK